MVGEPRVHDVVDGFNVSLMVYGQTGAGKTHTMMGNLHNQDLQGLAPRMLKRVFTVRPSKASLPD